MGKTHKTAPVTSSTSSAIDSVEVSSVTTPSFRCNVCEYTTTTEKGVKTHKGHKQKEQLRDKEESNSLVLSLVNQEREEQNYSPPLANSTIVSGLEEAKISLSRINYNCGRFEKVFNSEDDLSNNENNDYPLMCHICFNFSKDKDSKLKRFVEKHFQIPGAL